ncbi:hypothetical protein MIND_01071700 [Mycena indigotica]|uniref:Uncharacterized protein n=1 Tax=Mycena indigotica TaxID=2126181 RepID=A0A8H6S9I1_9AGAR|nr:uncharacterized protein MIND_01071700 [Mycena indigotica]KAF7295324.1 hypothetical protein MIND_01071700 [Mycena indigotica]
MLDNPVLVAPRPVRLSNLLTTRNRILSGPDHVERAKVSDETVEISGLEEIAPSQRSSPRSPLPSEALEEFLSILRPSFFPPTSPVLFTRRAGAVSLPTFQHERSYSFKGRGFLKNDLIMEELEASRSTQPSRNMHTPDNEDEADTNTLPVRWFTSSVLSSPISRTHTRNPFSRHILASPSPISPITLSPAAIPLPLPTPDELVLLELA